MTSKTESAFSTSHERCRPRRKAPTIQTAVAALTVAVALAASLVRALPDATRDCSETIAPPLPEEESIKDPVFAVLVGLLQTNRVGCVDPADLEQSLGPRISQTRLPYQRLRHIERVVERQATRILIEFDGQVDLPIPYKVIFLRPGRIRGPELIEMKEAQQRVQTFSYKDEETQHTVQIDDVTVFALERGIILVDFDGWIDRLTGPLLDDTAISGLAVFRYEGRWWGMGVGHNNAGKRRFGLFDLTRDEVIVRATPEMRRIAHHLRKQIEALAASERSSPQSESVPTPGG